MVSLRISSSAHFSQNIIDNLESWHRFMWSVYVKLMYMNAWYFFPGKEATNLIKFFMRIQKSSRITSLQTLPSYKLISLPTITYYFLVNTESPSPSQISTHQTFITNYLLYILSGLSPSHLQLNISDSDLIIFPNP